MILEGRKFKSLAYETLARAHGNILQNTDLSYNHILLIKMTIKGARGQDPYISFID